MLQQSSRLLLNRIGFDHAASAACTCLQQQLHLFAQQPSQVSQQIRSKSTAAGPLSDAVADAQQSNSGWSWFSSSSSAPQQPAPSLASDAAAEAAAAVAGAAAGEPTFPETTAAAAAAVAPAATDLLGQADVLVGVSAAATMATVAAVHADVWWGTRQFMDLMFWTHSLGVPWWASLIATNAIIRIVPGLPITYMQQKFAPIMGKMRQDGEKLTEMNKKIKKAKTAVEYAALAEEYQTAFNAFHTKYHGKKRYTFLVPAMGLMQAGLFISQFSAIMTLASAKLPSMTYEGALWFSDLTIPDPFMALPVMCAAATWLQFNTQRFKDQAMNQTSPQTMAMMKPLMSFMAVVIMFAGYFQPSAIALLWASNSLLMIGQNSLLSNPGVRKFVQLPPLEAAGPASSSSSSSSDSSLAGLMVRLSGQQEQGKQAVPASQVKAPPPGTPVAVNYVSKRPKRHIKVV